MDAVPLMCMFTTVIFGTPSTASFTVTSGPATARSVLLDGFG